VIYFARISFANDFKFNIGHVVDKNYILFMNERKKDWIIGFIDAAKIYTSGQTLDGWFLFLDQSVQSCFDYFFRPLALL